MTTYVEIHAIQNVPPSNINRDDSGTPKSAQYGGVNRHRVSSQSWKRAIREDFNATLSPDEIGTRSRLITSAIEAVIVERQPGLADKAEGLAVQAMEAAGFKKPVAKTRGKAAEGDAKPETGYLVFLSQQQINSLAQAAIDASEEKSPLAAMKAAKVKALVDADHSVDIALFGRMVADSTDLNVDAACQVAHAISVHEASPEYDFYTAVDDAKSRDEEEEDSGAGMMGTVGFVSSTLYRYAAVNIDQLRGNLGNDEATGKALGAFLRSFMTAMPSGKQTSFAAATRPSAVLITVADGQPTSLVGAFERPIKPSSGYVKPAIDALASHAAEVFETWRNPSQVLVTGTKSDVAALAELGTVGSVEEVVNRAIAVALEEA